MDKKGITLATKITIARLALIPLILFFYIAGDMFHEVTFFVNWGKLIALILFVIASLTDFLDGWIARRFNQVSDLGKLLDPIADKLLTTLGLILVVTDVTVVDSLRSVGYGHIGPLLPLWLAVFMIFAAVARDFIVSFVRQIAADKGIVYAANWSGKVKTTVQLFVIVGLMVYAHMMVGGSSMTFDVYNIIRNCSLLAAVAVIALNAYSTVDYIVKYGQKVQEKEKRKNKNSETEAGADA